MNLVEIPELPIKQLSQYMVNSGLPEIRSAMARNLGAVKVAVPPKLVYTVEQFLRCALGNSIEQASNIFTIVMPGSPLKNDLERILILDIQQQVPNAYVGTAMISLNDNKVLKKEFNVAVWLGETPTIQQRQHPVREGIAVPDIVIEVCNYFDIGDRNRAIIDKPTDIRNAGHAKLCLISIVLPEVRLFTSPQAVAHNVPRSRLRSVRSVPRAPQYPYVYIWRPYSAANNPIIYIIDRRHMDFLDLPAGIHINFDRILDVLEGETFSQVPIQNVELQQQVHDLEERNGDLEGQVHDLQEQVHQLRRDIAELRNHL
jgi:hypothetical protein